MIDATLGCSFGDAVVVQPVFNEESLKTAVRLSTQNYGIESETQLSEDVSVLLIHGEADETLPLSNSIYAYNLAHEPKRLRIYENIRHGLKEVSEEVYMEVKNWIEDSLR